MRYYKLVGETIHECGPFESKPENVYKTEVNGSIVSTIFLCLDHSFKENDSPLLFETVVFGGVMDERMERTSTFIEARNKHFEMIGRIITNNKL